MTARVLLVTGSRVLDGSPYAERARSILALTVESFAPTVIVAGDARGLDEWAIDEATTRGIDARTYALDGRVLLPSGVSPRRWADPSGTPEAARASWPLRRNRAMVLDVARLRDGGSSVEVLALIAEWSPTHGTHHTVSRAERYGLEITRVTFSGRALRVGLPVVARETP